MYEAPVSKILIGLAEAANSSTVVEEEEIAFEPPCL